MNNLVTSCGIAKSIFGDAIKNPVFEEKFKLTVGLDRKYFNHPKEVLVLERACGWLAACNCLVRPDENTSSVVLYFSEEVLEEVQQHFSVCS